MEIGLNKVSENPVIQESEFDYRISCVGELKKKLAGKRVALYGTGDNARGILKHHPDLSVIVLIDEKLAGEYRYGKYIVSLAQTLLLNINSIIIAAEFGSAEIVSDRIVDFCIVHGISLYNIYGKSEIERQRELLEQSIYGINLNRELLQEKLERYGVIYVQMDGVLGGYDYPDDESLLQDFCSSTDDVVFIDQRIEAETYLKQEKKPYSTADIYNLYRTKTYQTLIEANNYTNREDRFRINHFVVYPIITKILKKMADAGKKIYVLSDLHISQIAIGELAKKIGVCEGQYIVQENLCNKTLPNGMLRTAINRESSEKSLFIGYKGSRYLIAADAYGMDLCVLKKQNSIADSPFINESIEYMNKERKRRGGNISLSVYTQRILKGLLPTDDVMELEKLEFSANKESVPAEVSIIIPVYNNFQYTCACLCAIKTNTIKVPYEVIVIDDNSNDKTIDIESWVSGIRVIRNTENIGFLNSCNKAAREAKGKYIVFLNNDTQVSFNWLYPLVKLMEDQTDIGLTGSKLIYPDGTLQEAGGIIWNDASGKNYGKNESPDQAEFNYVREVDYISGAAIMTRKELWDDIGGFDEIYVPAYYEDTDIAFEVRKRGYRVVYQPASVVVHYEGKSNGTETSSGIKQYQVVNRSKFYEKWCDELKQQYEPSKDNLFAARERKGERKTILILSEKVPTYDTDTGSNFVWNYMKLFLQKGYIVKFVARDFVIREKYIFEMQQLGIETLVGDYYKESITEWIFNNCQYIDYAWLNYPDCGDRFIDILRCNNIPVIYFGHDLHFLRNRREYELNGSDKAKEQSEFYYEIEKKLIEKADSVYYPSSVEVSIAKETFGREDIKYLPLYFYENVGTEIYDAENRDGLMYIGGYGHKPNVDAVLWFVNNIYPVIYESCHANFYLVGSNQPIEIQRIEKKGVVNLGYISEEELSELYRKVRMVVIPLRFGAGVKGKVLDALYYGVPMVSTSIGIEGIPEAENVIDVADEAEKFAQKVIQIYSDYDALRAKSVQYRDLIRRHFTKEAAWDYMKSDFGE